MQTPPLLSWLRNTQATLGQRRALPWLLALLVAVAALVYVKYALAATFTVTSTADTGGSTCGGTCTLRQAINAANAAGVGPHTINFNIGSCGSGCTISVGSDLPSITRPVSINGTTQPGWVSAPLIRISGGDSHTNGLLLAAGSSGSTIRGLVISRFTGYGIRIDGSNNNVIAGNYLGTALDGVTANGNFSGAWVTSGTGNRFGGSTSADRNVIAGNNNQGVSFSDDNNLVIGNYIGVGANGSTAVGNTNSGVYFAAGVTNNRVGGTAAGEGNLIANNGQHGIIFLAGASSGNSFLGNRINNNGGLGIDLSNDGVTTNDGGDGDSGANGLQNFPVLTSAITNTVAITIAGNLSSNASTNYRLEFFSSATGDGSGYGQGLNYLGSTNVTTNGAGTVGFTQTITGVNVSVGHKVSAIATVDLGGGNYGSSSEFAQNATATLAPAGITVSAISGNTTEAGGTATFTVVLNRAPSANVSTAVSSNNTLEGTVSTALLTFTTANWSTPQTVTVTGVDDTLDDGDRAYTVVLAAATSADGAYNGLNPADVAVTNTDNDNQSTIVVTTNSDVVDGTVTSLYALLSNKGADGQISLREAITAANATANGSGGPDIINFAVGSGSFSIGLGSSLPALSQPTIVNGWSQTGYTSTPLVIIDCNQLGAIGIQIGAAALGSTVRGLVIRDCSSHAVQIDSGSNGNTVQGNYLGSFGAAGTDQGAGERNVGTGIYVAGANNQIGGNSAATRNVIGGNQSNGVQFSGAGATGNLLQGNTIGLNAAGAAAVANGGNGVLLDLGAASNVIGTNLDGSNDTTEGNVISGNTTTGIQLWGAGSGNAVRGNLIGVNPAATATLPNLNMGIQIGGATTNTVVGGTTAPAANTIGGNAWDAVQITSAGSTGNSVQGNYIGTNSGGTLNLGNGGGVAITGGAASNTLGGTATGAGNTIAFTTAKGVVVSSAGTGNAILGNHIHSNGGLGIDLADNGVTANDAGDADSGGNSLQNFPVLSSAVLNGAGTQVTISGSINTLASTPYRIEFFASTTADASGNGEGQRLIGSTTFTTDVSGNASFAVLLTVAVTAGESISATATKSNAGFTVYTDSSEFSANVLVTSPTWPVSGTVYEDLNYGGGAGRTLAASAGAGVNAARVELYNSAGTFVTSTDTASDGSYSFGSLAAGTYYVRVASQTVQSTRSGSTGTLRGVLTWRADASSGSAVAVTDFVGGTNPALADPGSGAGGTSFNTGTNVFTAGLSGTAHAVSPVVVTAAAVTGVNFGFNFSTVVNTNDSGQGSLRQVITNANALANTGLAQSGRSASTEHLVFMVSNGSTGGGGSLGLAGGLRASNNLFSGGVATVTPLSALPTLITPMVVDAQAQPGWTASPLIQINGASAGSVNGLTLTAGSTVLRGLNVRGYVWGVLISGASANTVEGCWVGVNAAGTAAAANGQGLWIDGSANNVIGGNTAAKRNVLSGNVSNAVVLNNATGTQIKGNYIGLNAAGTAAVANGDSGIVLLGSSTGTQIGGTGAGEGNVIAGNTGAVGSPAAGISIQVSTATGSVIQGNVLGLNAAQSAPIATVGFGIYVPAANTTIGGTVAGAGNVITAHSKDGIAVIGAAATAVTVQGNRIYGNTQNGIDLADNSISANDGAQTAGQPNLLTDAPVFTSATLSGTTLTVTGYVGSAPNQSIFGAARVEVFVSDASSSHGQGQTYLGFVTTDANGNFSGTIAGVTGVTIGSTPITGTATDSGGNTSEFGANATIGWGITGTVFEDAHYGGGAGRTLAAAAGAGVGGATVELYSSAGVWLQSTTTATSGSGSAGSYSFPGLTAGTYHVRVVNSTVASQRSGSVPALVGVMTYRTTAASGAAVAVTDQVGGTTPSQVDAAAGSAGATFNTSTGVFSAVVSGTAQAYAPVVVSTAIVAGVDFGFNFGTVVNANPSGQGSLRQALINANTLGSDNTLVVAGRTAALEHVIFMLADGTARPGLRNTFASQFAAGVATVTPTSALPAISAALVLDAQTQPGWVQDPIVELRGNAAGAVAGLELAAGDVTVRGLIINRFGSHGISISGGSSHTLQGCWIGTDATGAAAAANGGAGVSVSVTTAALQIGGTAAAARNVVSGNTSHGLNIYGAPSVLLQGNYVGTNASASAAVANGGRGVWLDSAVTAATVGGTAAGAGNVMSGNTSQGLYISGGATTVQGNFIGTNAAGTAALANAHGVHLQSGGHLVGGNGAAARNLISGNTTAGVVLAGTATASLVQGNVIGLNTSGGAALPNGVGVDVSCTSGCSVGGTAAGLANVISGNTGVGVRVNAPAQGNAVLGNRIDNNGSIGIDLNNNGVSTNDGAKTGAAANLLMDAPVFTSARARGNQLTVAGFVGSAAGQATFANARVEVYASSVDASGFGEGSSYLGFVTTDGSGNFNSTLTMPVSYLAVGTRLTGTATDAANNTSEFGANFSGLVVDLVVNHNGDAVDATPGDGICQTATPGQCTLRAALAEVNALGVQPGALTIAFSLPGCASAGQAACLITPSTALPASTQAVVVDGQTQTGWTLAPFVELVGSNAGAGTTGLRLQAANSTVRGLVVGGFTTAGIHISANNTTLQGNVIGLQADGSTARGNGSSVADGGVLVSAGTGTVIGGNTAAQRNVLAGNGGAGLSASGGSVTLLGNYIGTNAAGTAAVGNAHWGVYLSGGSGHAVGGAAAGHGNVISGHTAAATGGVYVGTTGVSILGNRIGINAAGSAYLPNGDGSSSFAAGIDLRSGSGHVVGGSAPGESNTIAGNQGHGIRVTSQTSRISGNSIVGNLWRGIDLGADNITANNGTVNGALPNNDMDHAVITGAGLDGTGTSLTVFGHIGTGTGQAVFAGARVEVFKAVNDGSGYGQGAVYLGFLTADANGRFSGTLAVTLGSVVVGDAVTATATDAAGNSSEFGPNWTSTTVAGLAPAGFNAFETDTAPGATSGVIRSKVAGTATTLAVLALDSAGTAPHAGFTGSVSLAWLDARDDSGALSGGCRATWVSLGAAGTATFSNNNRVDVALTPPATSTKAMRLQMTYVGGSGTVVACSTDAFAALPAQLAWLGASDTHSASAGTVRTLDNGAAVGGVVHQAGRPFTLRAQALSSGGVLMTAYDGTPALAITGCVLPGGCTPGTLGGGSATATAGVYTHNTVTYSEVGAVELQLTDTTYGNVDTSDTAAGVRTFTSSTLSVGRFVPDSYAVSVSTPGLLATANAACLVAGTGATFLGQSFTWATVPAVTVTARNAAGATTLLWTGPLMKLSAGAGLVPALAVASAGSATLATSWGASTVQDLGSGQARVLANALDRFVLDLAAGTYQATTTPTWQWQLGITDSSEAGTAGNPQPSATATQASVLFDQGGPFHSGRVALATAHGDARSGVRMLLQLQRYTAAGWVVMTEDRGCVTVQRSQLEMSAPGGVFVGAGVCAAPLAASATTAGGRAWLALPATPGGAPGRLSVRVAGSAASGDACSPAGAVQAVTSLGQPWLTGGTVGPGPQASASWGRPQRDVVLRREIW